MYLTRTPQVIQSLFPNFIWRLPADKPQVFLTFDDGPIPEVTPWVLDQLDEFGAKATFFCVGENVEKYPEIFKQLRKQGHEVGNHTYNHLSGWTTENIPYFHNVRRCASLVQSDLFRPPYGRIKPKQASFLQRHYQIVMWDVLSGDFDNNISKEQCLRNVINNYKPGSIIVFHDSLKSYDKLQFVLPRTLEYFASKGINMSKIDASLISKGLKVEFAR